MSLKCEKSYPIDCYSDNYDEYFKEEHVRQCVCLSSEKPNINEITDVFIHAEVVNTKLLETKDGLSNEGQKLTGYKLLVRIKLNEKVTYISNDSSSNICVLYYEVLKSVFIVLPKTEKGKNISDMYKFSRIIVTPTIEHSTVRKLDSRTIDLNALLLIQAKIC